MAKKEAVAGILAAVGLGGLAAILLSRTAKAEVPPENPPENPPEEELAADVVIEVYDSGGNPITDRPFSLNIGQSYTVKVTVENHSTLDGAPSAALMVLEMVALAESGQVASSRVTYQFSAGESKAFTMPVMVPRLARGPGVITADVLDRPGGNVIATGSVDFDVGGLPTASIIWNSKYTTDVQFGTYTRGYATITNVPVPPAGTQGLVRFWLELPNRPGQQQALTDYLFTSAGGTQTLTFSLIMPFATGAKYHVYFEIYPSIGGVISGLPLASYQAQDITVGGCSKVVQGGVLKPGSAVIVGVPFTVWPTPATDERNLGPWTALFAPYRGEGVWLVFVVPEPGWAGSQEVLWFSDQGGVSKTT